MSVTELLLTRLVAALVDALPELSADALELLAGAADRERQRRLAANAAHAAAQAAVDAALGASHE